MRSLSLWICASVILLSSCAPNSPSTEAQRARVADGARVGLQNAEGKIIGNLTVAMDGSGGVRFTGQVTDLSPGTHGIHIHDTGKCDAPDFKSAGPHFNPSGKQHGIENVQGPHEGDLENINIFSDGSANLSFLARAVTLGPGPTSLLKPGGTSLVIHAAADDLTTDPSGNSGDRIACGVITR